MNSPHYSAPRPRFWRAFPPMIALACALCATLPCEARLGDSIVELQRRYGRPREVEGTKKARVDHYTYEWQMWVVQVVVKEGRSVREEITRQDRRDFTLQEVHLLLAESTDFGLSWTQVNANTWRQRDRVATWSEKTLVVVDRGFGD